MKCSYLGTQSVVSVNNCFVSQSREAMRLEYIVCSLEFGSLMSHNFAAGCIM
jgi:hypothetical protein